MFWQMPAAIVHFIGCLLGQASMSQAGHRNAPLYGVGAE